MKKLSIFCVAAFLFFTATLAGAISTDNFTEFLTVLPDDQGTVTTTLPAGGWDDLMEGATFTSTLPSGSTATSYITTTLPANFPMTTTIGEAIGWAISNGEFMFTVPDQGVTTTTTYTTTTAVTPLPEDFRNQLIEGLELTTWFPLDEGFIAGLTTTTRPNLDNVIPEPASMLLIGIGLIGLAGVALKKKLFN
ncbi:MAG: PEP-CTERM sorting domain-containing protein [Deltaproteobacteria bacterium]|nr:PEP-CTERM sorting domain-containing protein [Deltaproteobacteria bacterium]